MSNGKYHFSKTIKQQALSLAYYDGNNGQHKRIIDEFDDEKKYYLEQKSL